MARKPHEAHADADEDALFGGEHAGTEVETEGGDGLVIDLSETTEGAGFEAVPVGVYDVFVESLEFGASQRSGNKMWTWTFQVEGDGEFRNRKFFYHTTFNEGGLPRLKRCLARIQGIDGSLEHLLTSRFNPQKVADEGILLGARCRIRVGKRKYEGEWRNDVKDVLPPAAHAEGDGFI